RLRPALREVLGVLGYQLRRNVAGLASRVDAVKVPNAFVMLRVLARADVDAILVHDRRGDEVAALALAAECVPRGLLWVAVELPELLACLRLERVQPAVAAGENDLRHAADLGIARVRPLAMHDVLARRIVLPQQPARALVQGDKAWRLRRGDVDVPLVDAV